MRADAARNRANLLTAARQAFTTHGAAARVDEIAKAAGIATGTLYRHYPTKEALAAAVLEDTIGAMATELEACRDSMTDPLASLGEMMRIITEQMAADQALKDAMFSWPKLLPVIEDIRRRGQASSDDIVAAAHAADVLAQEISTDDIFSIAMTIGAQPDQDLRATHLALVLQGLGGVG